MKEITETMTVQLTVIHRDCYDEDVDLLSKIDWKSEIKRGLEADDVVIKDHRHFIMDKE